MDASHDLVIGAVKGYGWADIEPYALSLCRSGFRGTKLMFVQKITPEARQRLERLGFLQIEFATPRECRKDFMSARFFPAWKFLKDAGEQFRYVIWTDVRDIVFQTDPSSWLDAYAGPHRLIAASECLRHQDEPWNRQQVKQAYGDGVYAWLKDQTIYNAGTFAGEAGVVCPLFLNVYLLSLGAANSDPDQAAFNILLHQSPLCDVMAVPRQEEGFACICGTVVDQWAEKSLVILDSPPRFDEGTAMLYPSTGTQPFCIVHQYDRTRWRASIENKYRERSVIEVSLR